MVETKLCKTISRLMLTQALHALDLDLAVNTPSEAEINKSLDSVIKLAKRKKEDGPKGPNLKFLKKMLFTLIANLEQVDRILESLISENKTITETGRLLKDVIRSGICEMLYFQTPAKVIVNEYTNLAAEFFSKDEVAFVNAILDKAVKAYSPSTK